MSIQYWNIWQVAAWIRWLGIKADFASKIIKVLCIAICLATKDHTIAKCPLPIVSFRRSESVGHL